MNFLYSRPGEPCGHCWHKVVDMGPDGLKQHDRYYVCCWCGETRDAADTLPESMAAVHGWHCGVVRV